MDPVKCIPEGDPEQDQKRNYTSEKILLYTKS